VDEVVTWCSTGLCEGAPVIGVLNISLDDGTNFDVPVCEECKVTLEDNPEALFSAVGFESPDGLADMQDPIHRVIEMLGDLTEAVKGVEAAIRETIRREDRNRLRK
jgi:hypothetical protein